MEFEWTEEFADRFEGPRPFVEVKDSHTTFCASLNGATAQDALASYRRSYDWNTEPGEEDPDEDPIHSWELFEVLP